MALSNTNYEAHAKSGNIQENWLFQFFNQDSYLEFDGSNDYVDCGLTTATSATSVTGQVSIGMWINFPTIGSNQMIFSNNSNESAYGGIWLSFNADNKLVLQWGDTTGAGTNDRQGWVSDSAVITSANVWYFVAVTTDFHASNDANTVVLVGPEGGSLSSITSFTETGGSNDDSPDYLSSNAYLYFGRRGDTTDTDFGAFKIRNFGMWSTQLNSNDAEALYNSGSYKSFLENFGNYDDADNLLAYWEFNNGDSTVRDLKGTLSGSVNGAKYGGFLPISTGNTTVDDIFYHGVITTNNISIRESLDLMNSKASSNNIRIDVANFVYQGDDFSAEILLGDNNYLNRGVRVFSQLNLDPDIADCMQIFSGRLTDIEHTIDSISLVVSSQRPWDLIQFPQTKHNKYNIYEPVVYGDYTPQTSSSSDAVHDSIFPVPKIFTGEHEFTVIMPRSYVSGDNAHLHYYAGLDNFLMLTAQSDGSIFKVTTTNGGVNVLNTARKCNAQGWILPEYAIYDGGQSVTFMSNPENAFALANNSTSQNQLPDDSIYASAVFTDANQDVYTTIHTLPRNFRKTFASSIKIYAQNTSGQTNQYYDLTVFAHEWSGTSDDCLSATTVNVVSGAKRYFQDGTDVSIKQFNFDQTPAYDSNEDLEESGGSFQNYAQSPDELLVKLSSKDVGGTTYVSQTLQVYYIQLLQSVFFYYDTAAGDDAGAQEEADNKIFTDITHFYCGGNGLKASWDDDDISHGHDAHRDLLIRFAGQDSTEPENYSALNTDRSINNWKIRYWQLEQVDLKSILEKIQYEFGFISKYAPDGKLKYIYIKQNSELSADHSLTSRDINNLKIKNSSLSNVITEVEVSNKKHPAEDNRYFRARTGKNVPSRTKYNYSAKENIKDVKLDMNIGTIANTPATDVNSDWYSYYDNIFGDVKILISCEVVNPAKAFTMETGDIVIFSDVGVDPGGTTFNNKYFMITDLNRSVGKVSISLREVG